MVLPGFMGLRNAHVGVTAPPPPLDADGGAKFAVGMRLLRTAYTGNCLKVRRDSDNATSDIGFDLDGNLDIAALETFVGAGNNGFVDTLYDQSGNAGNWIQSTLAEQPKIVDNGNALIDNGVAYVELDGIDDKMLGPSGWDFVNGCTVFYAYEAIDADGTVLSHAGTTGMQLSLAPGYRFFRIYDDTSTANLAVLENRSVGNWLVVAHYDGGLVDTGISGWINGIIQSLTPFSSGTFNAPESNSGVWYLADFNNTFCPNIKFKECIVYLSDKTSSRETIQNNINNYYSIY